MNFRLLSGMVGWFCCCTLSLAAQDKEDVVFEKIRPADFILSSSPIIDSNTNVVILRDVGFTFFKGNRNGWFSYVFKRRIRIKILNKKGMGLATVKLYLETRGENREKLDQLEASTYTLENGNIRETRLAKTDLFERKLDKETLEEKFTMPGVTDGSIIEYSYSIISDFYFNIPEWYFQSQEAPCLWSEYRVAIPEVLGYVFDRKGLHSLFIDDQKERRESYHVETAPNTAGYLGMNTGNESLLVSTNTHIHRWVMKDIPRLTSEDYVTTPLNYADKLEFQLSQTYNGETTREVMNSWAKATEELMKRDDFGAPLEEANEWLDPLLQKITPVTTDTLQDAKKIYYYLSRNFTCTDHNYKYLKTNLEDVVKKRTGSVGDLNLLLIALLRRREIKADPVLLSTREFGFNLIKYPILARLNYVVCRIVTGGKVFYLDASKPHLPFGQLAADCYNGHARVISRQDSVSVYFDSDSLRLKENSFVFLTDSGQNALQGSFQSICDYPGSFEIREKAFDSGVPGFFKAFQTANGPDVLLSNAAIDSLDNPEAPVTVRYDFDYRIDRNASLIYFSPVMDNTYKKNPFEAATRKYPVEMPYTIDKNYTLSMDIPQGYRVEEMPKSTRVSLNGNDGMFEYLIEKQGTHIFMRTRIKLDKTEFSPEDYNTLRDFFAFIAKTQSGQIVFKKKP